MPPFLQSQLVTGFKDKVDCLHVSGDKLYVAFGGGSVHVYELKEDEAGAPRAKSHLKKTGLVKRAIEQLGVLPDKNQLVTLSDSTITLWDLPDLKSPTVLGQARHAQSFGIASSWQDVPSPSTSRGRTKTLGEDAHAATTTRTLVTTLVVGCRKKVVVFVWLNGVLGPVRELSLPHSPRLVLFPRTDSASPVHMATSPTEFFILRIPPSPIQPLTYTDGPPLVVPAQSDKASASSTLPGAKAGMGAFSGLGGYVGKGFGALGGGRTGPAVIGTSLSQGELLVMRENHGVLVDGEGNVSRETVIDWTVPPEDLAFSPPYIISVIPPTSPSAAGPPGVPAALQVKLASTLATQQVIKLPNAAAAITSPAAASSTATLGAAIRSLTVAAPSTSPSEDSTTSHGELRPIVSAAFVSTPMDKLQLQTEGSCIWAIRQIPPSEQLDEMVQDGRFADGLGLLKSLPDDAEVDRAQKTRLLHTLQAVAAFSTKSWEPAMDSFMSLDVTPARVVALYPENTVSGRLHLPQDRWVKAFGGPENGRLLPASPPEAEDEGTGDKEGKGGLLRQMPHLGLTKRNSMETLKDQDKESVTGVATPSSAESVAEFEVYPPAAMEALSHYLSDRRQKLAGAIGNLPTPLPAVSDLPPLKTVPPEDLLDIPSVPMTQLSPEQLVRVSQIVYTALLKVYLAIRPTLVGSLCRIENWCEVEEVEGLLREREKYGDLVDLYKGKSMHKQALGLLKELSADEEDDLDKLEPTIRYLQKLGPNHLNLIFSESQWVFEANPRMATTIFTADEAEVEALPRHQVSKFLERTNRDACITYLEHIINTLGEGGPDFHDKLAELYLARSRVQPQNAEGKDSAAYVQLLEFLNSSTQYRPDRLIGRLKADELPRARAILLGRLGNHQAALQIYVYRLNSNQDAEDYCTRIYQSDPNPKGVFLLLLRIYLRPTPDHPIQLSSALALIASQGVRIDAQEVLALLPPMVTVHDVQSFFVRTLRDGHARRNEARVVKEVLKTRKEQVDRGLMRLQQKRVRITDIRICPQCHKRIGQSVISVHAPRGEVTHYQCKDAFAAKLQAVRA